MNTSTILETIEGIANPALQAPWDQSGIQVYSARKNCSKMAVFLDPTPNAVELALANGVDFLLSHHPLTLKPALPNRDDAYTRVIGLVMKANAILYAAHTSLDVNLSGPAAWLGQELRLENCIPLEGLAQKPDNHDFGYGQAGNLPKPLTSNELLEKIFKICGLQSARAVNWQPDKICTRLAYCGGSGKSLLALAEKAKADLYVTGDFDHHAALDASIQILDVGHHSLEEKMMRKLARILAKKLSSLEVAFFPSPPPFQFISINENSCQNI